MIHVYAFVDGLRELPDLPGLAGAPLERLRVGDLELVVSSSENGELEPSEQSVLRHARVVEELMARSDAILPSRLGQRFADSRELAGAVHEEAPRLGDALRRVRGCVELGLRVLKPAAGAATVVPLTGSEYLRARLAEQHDLEDLAASVHEPLARLSRASFRRDSRSAEELFAGAYLVPLDQAARFRVELERLESAQPELAFVCTGPWPPYSFAGEGEAA